MSFITFERYVNVPEPYMTGVMTGGGMSGALAGRTAALQIDSVASKYQAALDRPSHSAKKRRKFEKINEPGGVWNPGRGPRVFQKFGISGEGVIYLEHGGTGPTKATHAMRALSRSKNRAKGSAKVRR